MKKVLDKYLNFLNEQGVLGKAVSFVGKNAGKAAGTSLVWGAFYIPATILAWRSANALFSQAVRKCGGIKKSTPGFKVCVAKERIKALEQKITIANKILSGCNKAKDPQICKDKFTLEIEKAKNRIEINQSKIKEILGEHENLQEILPLIPAVAGVATFLVAGMIADKALFLANRTAQGLFSQAVRKCGMFKEGPEREICISKYKLQSLTKQLQIHMSLLSKCSKQKDPAKCNEKLKAKIMKFNRDIQIQKDNITSYTKESEQQKREKEFKEEMRNSNKNK